MFLEIMHGVAVVVETKYQIWRWCQKIVFDFCHPRVGGLSFILPLYMYFYKNVEVWMYSVINCYDALLRLVIMTTVILHCVAEQTKIYICMYFGVCVCIWTLSLIYLGSIPDVKASICCLLPSCGNRKCPSYCRKLWKLALLKAQVMGKSDLYGALQQHWWIEILINMSSTVWWIHSDERMHLISFLHDTLSFFLPWCDSMMSIYWKNLSKCCRHGVPLIIVAKDCCCFNIVVV